MNKTFFLVSLVLSLGILADNNDKEFSYSSIGINFIEAEKSGFAINLSIDLPGAFYTTLERKADGIDYKNESYDKIVDTVRFGAHMGIGDLIGSISAGEFQFKVKNLFDVFLEVGIKTSDFDGKKFNFQGDDTHASYLAGIRFGNNKGWEGKFFLDASKEATIIESENPVCQALSCPPYDAILSDESDKKFGINFLRNINNRHAFFIEASSSKVVDNTVKIGYQFNF